MFDTLGSFSAVYLTLAAILVLMVLFEKPLIALEDKWKEKRKQSRNPVKTNR